MRVEARDSGFILKWDSLQDMKKHLQALQEYVNACDADGLTRAVYAYGVFCDKSFPSREEFNKMIYYERNLG